ncbi:MAG: hypothetical protein QOE63_123 [Acidimicrobiaceae bacterium]|jgi:hypothetical protein
MTPPSVTELFLDTADVVLAAISEPEVASAWRAGCALEEQTIGGLAAHLARGGVWAVGDYLDSGVPDRPITYDSAGEYHAELVSVADAEMHRAIRDRGATIAADGHGAVVAMLTTRLAGLRTQLGALPGDHRVAVIGGVVLRLDDYLTTRLVEQVVHLDDLARSLGREPWAVHPEAMQLVLDVALEIGTRLHSSTAMLRAFYRNGYATAALPVL